MCFWVTGMAEMHQLTGFPYLWSHCFRHAESGEELLVSDGRAGNQSDLPTCWASGCHLCRHHKETSCGLIATKDRNFGRSFIWQLLFFSCNYHLHSLCYVLWSTGAGLCKWVGNQPCQNFPLPRFGYPAVFDTGPLLFIHHCLVHQIC